MPPSNPTPPPGGGGTQKLSLDPEALAAIRELTSAVKGYSQVTHRSSRTTAKAVDQQVVEARQSRQAPAKLKPPPKAFDQEVGEGIAAQQKRLALRSAVGAALNPPKTFDVQVQDAVAARRSRQAHNDAVNAHFKPAERTFNEQVGEGIAARQKRQALHDAVSAHFKLPPKTFEQQVEHTVAARQSSKALNDAVEAQLNPPKSFKERVQHAVTAQRDSKRFNDALARKTDPLGFALDGIATPAAAALAAAYSIGNSASSAARLAGDPYIGRAEASRQYFRDVVPGGSTFQAWADNLTGRTASLQVNNKQAMYTAHYGANQNEALALNASIGPLQAGINAAASARRGQQAALHPVMDRSSASGEQAFQIAMKLLPLKQETLRTEIAMKKASAETVAAENSAVQIAQRREQITDRMNTYRKARDNMSGDESAQEEGFKDQIAALQKQRDALRPLEEAATRTVFEKRAAEAVATGEHNKAQSRENLIGQAEVLQDQADRAKSLAFRLGSMNPLDREKALQAALVGKEHGLDALAPEMKAAFQAIAPKEYEAAAVKAGTNTRAYGELQKSGLVDSPGVPGTTPGALQHATDSKRMESGAADFAIDKGVDAALEAGAKKMSDALTRAIARLADMVVARVNDDLLRGK